MFNTVVDKRIVILGFAFKANTGDTRESPAIDICKQLLAERALLVISDPKALKNAKRDLTGFEDRISFEEDPYKSAENAHALAVLTEWDHFKSLNYQRIYESMVKPAFIFDGRNILDHDQLFKIGFNVYPIGKPEMTHI